jgi:type II secretory pathway pseudopilin PulG
MRSQPDSSGRADIPVCRGCGRQESLPQGPRRGGFLLIEVLILMISLVVVMLVGGAALLGGFKAQRTASATQKRLNAETTLADEFRPDVARAEKVVAQIEQLKTGPKCLLLRWPDGKTIVYRWDGKKLERSQLPGSKDAPPRKLPLGPDCTAVEFLRTGPDRRVITVRLTEKRRAAKSTRSIDISAALGGDLR